MHCVFALLAFGAAVAFAQNCPGTQQSPYSNCGASSPCAEQGCQCMQLSITTQGCCPVAQPPQAPQVPQQPLCPGGAPPQSSCSQNAGCPQQSSCQCTTLTTGDTGCCPTNFAAPVTPTAAPMVYQVSVCSSGAAPVCSCQEQSTCQQYNSQCQPLSSGGQGCCPQGAQQPAYQPQKPMYQPQQQQISITIQPLCQSGAAPVSDCGQQNQCAQSNCVCMQLNTGGTGCCEQAAPPPPPPQQQPQQSISITIQPICPQTNQAPISTGCQSTNQCQAQQSDCACVQLNTGASGCCQQPQAPALPPAPVQQPQQPISITISATCPQTGAAPISTGCSATSQCQQQQPNCVCVQLSTGSSGCCQAPSAPQRPPMPPMRPMPRPEPEPQFTITITPICPQTNQAPISTGCQSTNQCQAQQSDCACVQLNTGASGCCQQPQAPALPPAPVQQPQQPISITITPTCPQTGAAPISTGCNSNSQCQSQQSNCVCIQLNTGSNGCCAQPSAPAPPPYRPPPMAPAPVQPSYTITIQPMCSTGAAPISTGCQSTSQCQAQQSNCGCEPLNTGAMGCCPQPQQPMRPPMPQPVQQPQQQQFSISIQATCPQTGAAPISTGCQSNNQCQAQQANCVCIQLSSGGTGCCQQSMGK